MADYIVDDDVDDEDDRPFASGMSTPSRKRVRISDGSVAIEINRTAAPASKQPSDELALTEWAYNTARTSQVTQVQKLLREVKNRPIKRTIELREKWVKGDTVAYPLDVTRGTNVCALLGFMFGSERRGADRCSTCVKRNGPFARCVV